MLPIRPRFLVLFAAVLLSCLPLAAQTPKKSSAVTLEGLMSAPFPEELLASPTGAKLAWIEDGQGARNVWVAEPPEYKGRRVTHYTGDDGQEIGGLEWMPDAKTLIYVRGGRANGRGESPNPTSNPAGAEQAIWRVALDGSEPVRMGKGSGGAGPPKGDGVGVGGQGPGFWGTLAGPGAPGPGVGAPGGCRRRPFSPGGAQGAVP